METSAGRETVLTRGVEIKRGIRDNNRISRKSFEGRFVRGI